MDSIFQGARPADRNGLYFIAETAVTPQIGRSQLPGKYVFGGYYWGIENTSFFGEPFDGKFGFYWQEDQMLWREPSPKVVEEKGGDAKTFTAVAASKPKLNDQGLRWFSFFIQVNKWAFVQPFLQYLIRPNGPGLVQNATVIGLHFGVEF